MASEFTLALVQAMRWIIAGVAGAAFAKHDVLDKGFWYLIVYIPLLILMFGSIEYVIRIWVLTP